MASFRFDKSGRVAAFRRTPDDRFLFDPRGRSIGWFTWGDATLPTSAASTWRRWSRIGCFARGTQDTAATPDTSDPRATPDTQGRLGTAADSMMSQRIA